MLLQTGVRLLCLLFSVTLLFCALLQINDPDPQLWMLVYGLSAVLPALAATGRGCPRLLWLCIGLCVAGFAVSIAGAVDYVTSFLGSESLIQDMSPNKPYIEQTREFIGTAIVVLLLLLSEKMRSVLAAQQVPGSAA